MMTGVPIREAATIASLVIFAWLAANKVGRWTFYVRARIERSLALTAFRLPEIAGHHLEQWLVFFIDRAERPQSLQFGISLHQGELFPPVRRGKI